MVAVKHVYLSCNYTAQDPVSLSGLDSSTIRPQKSHQGIMKLHTATQIVVV